MFIGRERELKTINKFYESSRYEMLVIYGRRRVGKTKLITEFMKDKKGIYYAAEENNDKRNRERFTKEITNYFEEGYSPVFENWNDIFGYISQKMTDERFLLVIDELPYLAYGNSSFLSILQNAIDHLFLEKNIMIILCGSAISFMENELVAHKSPLYGRKTGQMNVKPLEYHVAAEFFKSYSNEEKALTYGILGGIPHYLIKFSEKNTLKNNIIENVLDTSSFLFDEPMNLLYQELRNPATYNAIIEAIANGASRANEIATKIGETPTKTSKYLKSLIELQIIKKETPIGEEKSKKSIFLLNDMLYRFIYRYVYANRSLVEQGFGEYLYSEVIKPDISNYMGRVFEDICKEYLLSENKKMNLPFIVEEFGTWWGNNPKLKKQEEIDIVGLSKDKGIYCECKYRNGLLGVEVYNKLVERSSLVPKEIKYYYLFSKSGFTNKMIELEAASENIYLIELNDLYKDVY